MRAGQDPALFPQVTLREMAVVLEASSMRDERQAWLSAQYNAFAFHQPNEMPPDPFDSSAPPTSDVDDEIKAIRRRVKLAYDTKRAKRNGN